MHIIQASLNPETAEQELILSGTTYDASFHLIQSIPANKNEGIPFITLIEEVTMKIKWSKAFNTDILFPKAIIHYEMTSLTVSNDRTKIAGLTSNTNTSNYLFILDRQTGNTLQTRVISN